MWAKLSRYLPRSSKKDGTATELDKTYFSNLHPYSYFNNFNMRWHVNNKKQIQPDSFKRTPIDSFDSLLILAG